MCDILPHYGSPGIHLSLPLSTIGENVMRQFVLAAALAVALGGVASAQPPASTALPSALSAGWTCDKVTINSVVVAFLPNRSDMYETLLFAQASHMPVNYIISDGTLGIPATISCFNGAGVRTDFPTLAFVAPVP
jgi:hypothetical protein